MCRFRTPSDTAESLHRFIANEHQTFAPASAQALHILIQRRTSSGCTTKGTPPPRTQDVPTGKNNGDDGLARANGGNPDRNAIVSVLRPIKFGLAVVPRHGAGARSIHLFLFEDGRQPPTTPKAVAASKLSSRADSRRCASKQIKVPRWLQVNGPPISKGSEKSSCNTLIFCSCYFRHDHHVLRCIYINTIGGSICPESQSLHANAPCIVTIVASFAK